MKTSFELTPNALQFLEKYLNNASPTGYESGGQKIWMDYLKPYVNHFTTDIYGTAVGVINPDAQFKVVFNAIRKLMTPPRVKPRRRIGF